MIGDGEAPVRFIDLDRSTRVEADRPALRLHFRARLAELGKAAVAMLSRRPARPSRRASAGGETACPHGQLAARPVAGQCAHELVGAGLDTQSILEAYRRGLVLERHPERAGWLSPPRREAIAPQELRIGSPLRRLLRDRIFGVSFDTDFAGVIAACEAAAPAEERLAPDLVHALLALHRDGHAHSVEVISPDGALVGGLYGIAVGEMFFVEAKFERRRKASAVALAVLHHHLNHWGFVLRSARWSPPRGVHMVGREIFQMLLDAHAAHEHRVGRWVVDSSLDTYAWSVRPRVACRRPRNGSLPPLSARKKEIVAGPEPCGAGLAQGGALARGA